MRVTVPGAPPRTDIGFNAVAEDNADGHETAIKGAVTDGMKRALRSFGVQFGNGFYGDQPVEEANGRRPAARQTGRNGGGASRTQRAPAQAKAASGPDNVPALRKRLIEVAAEQGFDEDGVRTAVKNKTGKEPRRPGRPRSWPRWWRPPQRSSRRRGRRRRPSLPCTFETRESSGVVSSGAAPLLHLQDREATSHDNDDADDDAHTLGAWTQDIEELAEGVWRVSRRASHSGLKLSRERWYSLPDCVRDAMFNATFAEEDCEEAIVRTLLGLGGDRERELALKVAGYFDRYALALPHLRAAAPGPHYHAVAYWGGYGTDPFGHFDTREEADSFASDGANRRLEAVECGRSHNGTGGRP